MHICFSALWYLAWICFPVSSMEHYIDAGSDCMQAALSNVTAKGRCWQGILCNILLSFCRHFGGTKLGTGGLARAYGGAARECLRIAEKVLFQRQATLCMQVTQIHTDVYMCTAVKLSVGCSRVSACLLFRQALVDSFASVFWPQVYVQCKGRTIL